MKIEEGVFFTDTRWENIPVHYINAGLWEQVYEQLALGKRYLLALCGKSEQELLKTPGIQMWRDNESILFRLMVEFQTAGTLYGGISSKLGDPILKWAKQNGISFSDFKSFNKNVDWADHKYYGNVISNHRAIQSDRYNQLLRPWGLAYPLMPKEQIWPKSEEYGFEAYEKAVRDRQIAAKKAMEERAKAKKSQASSRQENPYLTEQDAEQKELLESEANEQRYSGLTNTSVRYNEADLEVVSEAIRNLVPSAFTITNEPVSSWTINFPSTGSTIAATPTTVINDSSIFFPEAPGEPTPGEHFRYVRELPTFADSENNVPNVETAGSDFPPAPLVGDRHTGEMGRQYTYQQGRITGVGMWVRSWWPVVTTVTEDSLYQDLFGEEQANVEYVSLVQD